jgi:malate dehydrogenase
VEPGLITSFPIRTVNAAWEIAKGVSLNDFSRSKIDLTLNELKEEREMVKELL